MQNTTNYGLNKPDLEDFYNVNDFNENMDTIDAALFALQSAGVGNETTDLTSFSEFVFYASSNNPADTDVIDLDGEWELIGFSLELSKPTEASNGVVFEIDGETFNFMYEGAISSKDYYIVIPATDYIKNIGFLSNLEGTHMEFVIAMVTGFHIRGNEMPAVYILPINGYGGYIWDGRSDITFNSMAYWDLATDRNANVAFPYKKLKSTSSFKISTMSSGFPGVIKALLGKRRAE